MHASGVCGASEWEQRCAQMEELTGEQLSSVCFVHDYVEFHFDDKIVRSLTMPVVTLGDARFVFPEPGSRDALCALIGCAVANVIVAEATEIVIEFKGMAKITIPLTLEEGQGPEAAHYIQGKGRPVSVW